MRVFFYLAVIALSSFGSIPSNDVLELPIKLIGGYGKLPAGFMRLSEVVNPESPLDYAVKQNLTGFPRDWTNVRSQYVLFEPSQFIFQSYKQQLIDADSFSEFKERRKVSFDKRSLSEEPIKCLVYVIFGRDKKGVLKYKIDVNNNFNFSDESEYIPPKIDWSNLDLLASKYSVNVKYESFRNGKVVELYAPLLIVDLDNGFYGVNIPHHGEAEFEGSKILISSQGFTTTDFDSLNVYNSSRIETPIKENEILKLGENYYRNLGFNINKHSLILEKLHQ